jgi:hypothetical protein
LAEKDGLYAGLFGLYYPLLWFILELPIGELGEYRFDDPNWLDPKFRVKGVFELWGD